MIDGLPHWRGLKNFGKIKNEDAKSADCCLRHQSLVTRRDAGCLLAKLSSVQELPFQQSSVAQSGSADQSKAHFCPLGGRLLN